MSYLMRVRVPDSPGALGKIAQALGNVDGNIRGVDDALECVDVVVLERRNEVLSDRIRRDRFGRTRSQRGAHKPRYAKKSRRPFHVFQHYWDGGTTRVRRAV